MSDSMLVRTADGAWEKLVRQDTAPDGGFARLFGDDIGPVIGSVVPVIVVADVAELSPGCPACVCLDAEGNVTVAAMAPARGAERSLPDLLGHAGTLHGLSLDAFSARCNRVGGGKGSDLTTFVHERTQHPDFDPTAFEMNVADALAQARFSLLAMVTAAPPSLVQSMRYLNASGASVLCYEISTMASDSVVAVRARSLDVGQQQRQVQLHMTAAGMSSVCERVQGARVARLLRQLQSACETQFDQVTYGGDSHHATMDARLVLGGHDIPLLHADDSGAIVLTFESLAPADGDWTVRAELCQAMNRMLGADLGDVRKISKLKLSIEEHLMDDTLMEAFVEVVADTVETLREYELAGQCAAAPAAATAA